MNKFFVADCIDAKESGYDGPCVVLANSADPSFALFFPVLKEHVKLIKYVLNDKNEYDINTNVLGVYKTMIDSWHSGDRFLSGIIMDTVYEPELKDTVLMIRLALSGSDGEIDSLVHVNFLHAVLLGAMEKIQITVSDQLLEEMRPKDEDDDDDEPRKKPQHFPEDKSIVNIAKKIMSGKVKNIKDK